VPGRAAPAPAASSRDGRGERIAHLSIVTAPGQRGRSLATAAAACAAPHALAEGLVPPYRTLESNAATMGVARRLGFERYGCSVSVRLAAP
jgi:RimJ/RimL family protein N-acetyltransferase